MLSIIIYTADPDRRWLDKTIEGIADRTADYEIIVCDDSGEDYLRKDARVLATHKLGRARAWNAAARVAGGDYLVFVKDKIKVGDGWASPLLAALDRHPSALVSPVVHTLDLHLWATEPTRWRRFGWRWDLNLYDRQSPAHQTESPAVSSYCLAVTKGWFNDLGGFDDGMVGGSGEDLELSLRCWLLGGSVLVCDGSTVAVALEVDCDPVTNSNLARVAEVWFPKQAGLFYQARGLKQQDVRVGRLQNLLAFQKLQKRDSTWFLRHKQPELLNIYGLRGSGAGKQVAVVAPGVSIDSINPALIERNDVVIGIDYMGMVYDCDFVVTDSVPVLNELRARYGDQRLVLPTVLHDVQSGAWVASGQLAPSAQHFELGMSGVPPVSLDPPFCNFENLALAAVHFALFLNPSCVTVYGLDNKVVGGVSHPSKIKYYDDGKLWPDSDSTRRRFAFYEQGLGCLGQLASAAGVPLLRVSHA